MSRTDLLIVGGGPAGMSAAIRARGLGLAVTVIDDQPSPGGQIWRSVELTTRRDGILGPAYVEGRAVADAFRACGAIYRAGAQLWQVEPGFTAFLTLDGQAEAINASALVFATGAQERPVPFAGWTLPGVLTVGAAQILLKNAGEIPIGPVWIAGSGPLPMLYAVQLLRAGGKLAGYLDTTPRGQWRSALRHLPSALRTWGDLAKGVGWMAKLRAGGMPFIGGVDRMEALGADRIEAVRFRTRRGRSQTVRANTLLVHEGVVPNIHSALSLGCEVYWNAAQDCFAPILDIWGESSQPGVFIAGDAAGIAGAKAAQLRGEVAAIGVALKLGRIDADTADAIGRPVRRNLGRELAARSFLDAMFQPRSEIFAPTDDTVVCRCEGVTAGQVRALAQVGRPGPNQVKTATRMGMGLCQGRQCGYTLTRLLEEAQNRPPAEIGYLRIRPPLKPVTLGELATLRPSAES
jgi:NADPH-dependent 2,4-dienoyl-CoA reductase/sulfur reductase-like enzyme